MKIKTIKFNERDLEVWEAVRDLYKEDIWLSPTKIGLHIGFDYNTASSKCNRTLKKLVNEKILLRSKEGKYQIDNFEFNMTIPELEINKRDSRTDKDIGWIEGLWYAIEQLVINYDLPNYAKFIIQESNLSEWEFRSNLEKTKYEVERLTEFLDEIFQK